MPPHRRLCVIFTSRGKEKDEVTLYALRLPIVEVTKLDG